MNDDLEKADLLCLEYCLKLSKCDYEGAKAVACDLDKQFSSLPMQEIPFFLKKRFELHEILKRVFEATGEDYTDNPDILEHETFKQLKQIFDSFHGDTNDPLFDDIRNSETMFENYKELRQFQAKYKITPPANMNDFIILNDNEFTKYMVLICDVIHSCEIAVARKYSFVEASFCKEDLVALLRIVPDLFNELNKQFITVFCFGLKLFHVMCGRPKEFKMPDGLACRINETQNSEHLKLMPNPAQEKRKKSFKDIIRSKSPPKESEIVKADGSLWESSDEDVDISVSSSSVTSRRQKWTDEETNSLIDAVKYYGIGNWQSIICDRRYSLNHKTNIQLKDKWRIMTEHNDEDVDVSVSSVSLISRRQKWTDEETKR